MTNLPQSPHMVFSPSGPFLRPIAISSGHPHTEQCHFPLIIQGCKPSANSLIFASATSFAVGAREDEALTGVPAEERCWFADSASARLLGALAGAGGRSEVEAVGRVVESFERVPN